LGTFVGKKLLGLNNFQINSRKLAEPGHPDDEHITLNAKMYLAEALSFGSNHS
jgi:hypothetical protein